MAKKKTEDSTNSAAVYVRYVATALEYIPGVPQRDLSASEWAALPEDMQRAALESKLYVIVEESD
jgi:hypothetical protein